MNAFGFSSRSLRCTNSGLSGESFINLAKSTSNWLLTDLWYRVDYRVWPREIRYVRLHRNSGKTVVVGFELNENVI